MRIFTLFFLVLPVLAQHGQYVGGSRNSAIGKPEAIAEGAKLFGASCAGCHGLDGSGGRGPNLVQRSLWHPLSDENIVDVVRNGVPGADMPATNLTIDQTWNLVAFLRSLVGVASESAVPGDSQAGGQVFFGTKAGCTQCHSIQGRGGGAGPDLSNIGGNKPLGLIRESVLHPSRKRSFLGSEAVTVTMKSGRLFEGIARNRDNYSLQVVDQKGGLHLIEMADVKELAIRDGSAMPADYSTRLSAQELQDLLAFLARQVARPKEIQP